ncbi:MAG TPA: amidohydrolase family protein, partial [Sphingobacterium sp.]|nr:amidohydrolase family protein [Sphingobacterium sp.]
WRIEHAQIVDSADIEKFKRYNVIPSIQPTHATSDMYWAADRLGHERLKNAYAYRKLLDQYGKVAIGSDFPVEHFNPLYGFHAAVARVDKEGFPSGGFQMDQALTREEALRAMTIWAAYACFQEKNRGSIEKGKDADFVILDKDIMTIPLDELRDTKTRRTVIAGESVFVRTDKAEPSQN